METIKTTDEHVIVKKRSGRYGVKRKRNGSWVNGEDKVNVLLAAGVIKQAKPKAKPEEKTEAEDGGEAKEDA